MILGEIHTQKIFELTHVADNRISEIIIAQFQYEISNIFEVNFGCFW
jgi:hypothetical protein